MNDYRDISLETENKIEHDKKVIGIILTIFSIVGLIMLAWVIKTFVYFVMGG